MEDARIQELARKMIQKSIGLQPGERILIEVHGTAGVLGKALLREAYNVGGEPYFHLHDYELEGALLTGATTEQMKRIARYELIRMEEMDAYIDIRAMDNVNVWNRVPADSMAIYRQEYWGPLHLERRCNHTRWVVTRYPNNSMAQLAGMSTDEYEDFYFKACLLDYEKMGQAMAPLAALMERTNQVRITGPGTTLTFSIKGMSAHPSSGHSNLPDGEIYTAPIRNSVNGTLLYNAPSPYDGTVYTGVALTFENGRIVDATCNDTPGLCRILDTDEGARYIGEFALGVNPVITKPMEDILFDEKISGSFHFTPGNAYANCDNGNRSSVHWDLVCIQRPEYGGGEIWFDDLLVRRDGLFVPPDLQSLNPQNLLPTESKFNYL